MLDRFLTSKTNDSEYLARVKGNLYFTSVFLIMISMVSLGYLRSGHDRAALFLILVGFPFSFLSIMSLRYSINLSNYIGTLGFLLVTCGGVFLSGNLIPGNYITILTLPSIFFLLNEKKSALTWTFFSIIPLLFMFFWQKFIVYHTEPSITISTDIYFQTLTKKMTVTFLGIAFMSYIFRSNQERLTLKIEQNKSQLQEKTDSISAILSNINHGIIPIIEGGKIDIHYSKFVEEIFQDNNIQNKDCVDLVFGKSNVGEDLKSQIKSVFDSSIGSNPITFELNQHVLPKEIEVEIDRNKKYLELNWDAIQDGDKDVYKILLTIKDVTNLKLIKHEEEKKSRSIQILTQLIVLDLDKLTSFFSWSNTKLAEVIKLLESEGDFTIDKAKNIFRTFHTLKGTARMFSFSFLVDVVHAAEQKYDDFLKKKNQKEIDKNLLIDDVNLVRNAINEYKDIYNTKLLSLSKSNKKEKEKFEELSMKVMALKDYIGEEKKIKQKFYELCQFVHANEFENFEKLCDHIVSSLSSLASEIGKKDVNVKFLSSNILFDKREMQALTDILIHSLRNSVDHGIERPEVRQAKGKPEIGTIILDIRKEEKYGVIEIEDDGGGLNLIELEKKGIENNLLPKDASNQQIADIIFYSGVSTAKRVTEISGRGVGMEAVKKSVQKKGGDIKINLKGKPNDDGTVPFSLIIYLPAQYFYDSSEHLLKVS